MDAISLHDYVAEKLLDTHKPTYTGSNEAALQELFYEIASMRLRGETWDQIDLTAFTLRTCECGETIRSFDDYRDHLKNVMMEAQP